MGKGVILFSGVHGVGKGYFIKENIKDNDDIICISAVLGNLYLDFLVPAAVFYHQITVTGIGCINRRPAAAEGHCP